MRNILNEKITQFVKWVNRNEPTALEAFVEGFFQSFIFFGIIVIIIILIKLL